MKNVIFIPHKIEGEESLPKVIGRYILVWKDKTMSDLFTFDPKNISDVEWWIDNVAYWLEEVPVPTDEERRKEQSEYLTDTEERAFVSGWKSFKSKLGIK